MADKHHPRDDQRRNEPTLGQAQQPDGKTKKTRHQDDREDTQARGAQEADRQGAQEQRLKHERRDERQHVRVNAPFQLQLEDGHTLPGDDLSLGGFAVHSDMPFEPGKVITASLLLMAGSAELIVPITAKALRNQSERGGNSRLTAFEIVQMDQRHRELLRRIVRSHLSGRYAAIEDLIENEDPQTPRKRATLPSSAAAQGDDEKKPAGRYLALFAAAAVLLLVIAATVYRNFMLIEPSFAAVTAPRIDILAPGAGQLSDHSLEAGDRVERDQPLAKVYNSDLETDLILARAAFNYNAQLIENMRDRFDDPGVEEVSMAQSTTPTDGRPPSFESVSPEVAKIRIEQFETAKGYENARVDALEARLAANTIYSPCDCVVAWALSSAGGTYINESDRIMTLIRTNQDDIMVEALVHMSDIGNIEPHQRAYVALPNASEPIAARVRSVALDIERQPRAGFPEWVRQEQNVASVLLVPEEPLPADTVGIPVDVRFSETPLLDSPVEWVWQGGRAIAQQTKNFFSAILSVFS